MIEGFFSKKSTQSLDRPDGKALSCFSCGLFNNCRHPKMEPYGNFKKKILNIGEAPGEIEDQAGKPFQGKTGQLLQRTYKKLGIDLFDDCLNINAVRCRPVEDKSNRPPTNYEVDCCRVSVLKIIEEYKPKLIVLLGNSAVYSLIGHRWKKDFGGITKWRGWSIPDQDIMAWICPTFHPSFVERAETSDIETIWMQDLQSAFEHLKLPFAKYKEPTIETITDLRVLFDLKGKDEIAFDYETTGLKPHAVGQRIVSVSIADSEDHCYVFMMPNTKNERMPFIELLADYKIGKIAHNMKFEDAWSTVRLKQPVVNWVWDTMIGAHVLDNRPGITSLKFQAYVQFGLIDYASKVSPYLQFKQETQGANSINQIMELVSREDGRKALLHYGGLDSINTYRLADRQRINLLPF